MWVFVQGLGFRVSGFGFRVSGLGFGAHAHIFLWLRNPINPNPDFGGTGKGLKMALVQDLPPHEAAD